VTADLDRAWRWTLIIAVAVTALRVLILNLTDLNLGPDEAQYWFWSTDLAAGYYSKPPMIAWIIAGSTSVCGDGEACVRTASPLLYGLAALFVFGAARILYGVRAAFWSALLFLLLPGISLSAALITTDVPLLCFWAMATYGLAVLLSRQPAEGRLTALLTGAVIGLAMLSKYAGAYFLLGLAVAAVFDRRVRAHVLGWNGLLILAGALVVFSPNIVWNLHHSFATVSHTAFNAGLGGKMFNFDRLAEFFGAQFIVFHPILMGVILAGLLVGLRRNRWPFLKPDDVVLLALSLPVIAIGLGIGFLSKANANWAAPAFVGLSIVAAVWLLRVEARRWMQASLAVSLVVMAGLYTAALSPRFIDMIGQSNAFKLLRGWNTQGPAVVRTAREGGFEAIMAEDREDMASLLYYTRQSGVPILMWTPEPSHPSDHFQMMRAYAGAPDRVLFITRRDDSHDVTDRFAAAREIKISSIRIGNKKGTDVFRTFHLIDASGFNRD
jgi:4-amino-4-deoxy-L-arabinose transferase-like glycosyltransferase